MAKTALITGASQGLGACMAKTLAADGFNIAINCLGEKERENGGNQVAEACRAQGVEAECFLCDVSDFNACEAMAKAVKERFGFSYWDAETSAGRLTFTLQDTFKSMVRAGGGRLFLFDVDGNRFVIEDTEALDRRSYKKIELYL